MKIIVVSDSHGSSASLKEIIKRNADADVVVHCGDSRGEMEEIKLTRDMLDKHPGLKTIHIKVEEA